MKKNSLYIVVSQSNLFRVLLLSIIFRFFYFGLLHPNMIVYNSDSVSYCTVINSFANVINLYKPPVYPLFINLSKKISNKNFVHIILIVQQVISFLSIIPFYLISKHFIKNKYLVAATTLFYSCWPPFINWNVNFNPECLCIIGSTVLLYLIVKYTKHPTKYIAISVGILPFILIMLKPTYVISLVLVFAFFSIRLFFFRNEKALLWGLLGSFIALGGVLGYCTLNKNLNGEFVLSKIAVNNSLANIIISGAYQNGEDKEFIAIIDSTKNQGFYTPVFLLNNECVGLYQRCNSQFPKYLTPTKDMVFCNERPKRILYSSARINQFLKKAQHSSIYVVYIIKRCISIFFSHFQVFAVMLLESIIIAYVFRKKKKIAWPLLFSILFIVGQFFTVAFFGIDDIDRLLVPCIPFEIQLGAFFLSSFDKNKFVINVLSN